MLNVKIRGLWLGGQSNSVTDDAYNQTRTTICVGATGFTSTSHGVYELMDTRVATYQGLIKVIFDRSCLLRVSAKDSTGYIPAAEVFEHVIPVNEVFEFGGSGSAAPYKQSLFLLLVSDSVGVSHPGFEDASRFVVEYVDMA